MTSRAALDAQDTPIGRAHREVFNAVWDSLVMGAPGLTEPIKRAIAISVALKLRERISEQTPANDNTPAVEVA